MLQLTDEALRSKLGHGADDLARIVPEIRERLNVQLQSVTDPGEERYRLLQAASDFLRVAAVDQPLLIVLEDLHDADHGTLDMLTRLARNLSGSRLLIIGTYRDVEVDRAHPLANTLVDLRKVTAFERITLRGLTQDEVHRMLQAIAGHDVPWRWAEAVHRQTEGNPLFVQEVMRYLVEEGMISPDGEQLQRTGDEALAARIPEGLRDVIGKRLTRLDPQTNRVLSVAAVIGREFRFDVLGLVAELSEDDLIAALDQARNSAVLEERTASGGAVSYRFGHAFFRQTLYEEISAPRRIAFHQRVARALEQVHARRLPDHASELAEHLSHSSTPDDLAKAVDYAEMAAHQATTVHAYAEAVRSYEQAIDAQEVLDPDNVVKQCDLLTALGEVLLPAGDPRRSYDVVAPRAMALAEKLDDSQRASRVCQSAILAMGRFGYGSVGSDPAYRAWIDRVDRYAASGSADRIRVDTRMGVVLLAQGELSASRELVWRALSLARTLDAPEALFEAASLAIARTQMLEGRETLKLAEEFLERPATGVSVRRQGQMLFNCGFALLSWGRREQAVDAFRRAEDLATRTADPSLTMNVAFSRCLWEILDGRLEDAERVGRGTSIERGGWHGLERPHPRGFDPARPTSADREAR